MIKVKKLLELLENKFTNKNKEQHHALTLSDGQLMLSIVQNNEWTNFYLSDEDLKQDPEDIIMAVEEKIN